MDSMFELIAHLRALKELDIMPHSDQRARAWKYMRVCAYPLDAVPNFRAYLDRKVQIRTRVRRCERSKTN